MIMTPNHATDHLAYIQVNLKSVFKELLRNSQDPESNWNSEIMSLKCYLYTILDYIKQKRLPFWGSLLFTIIYNYKGYTPLSPDCGSVPIAIESLKRQFKEMVYQPTNLEGF